MVGNHFALTNESISTEEYRPVFFTGTVHSVYIIQLLPGAAYYAAFTERTISSTSESLLTIRALETFLSCKTILRLGMRFEKLPEMAW